MSLEISEETTFLLDMVNLSYSAEYQAVYNSFTTKPSAWIAANQNTMVNSLISAGVWAKLDALWIFAQTTNGDSEALKNWIDPGTYDATLENAPAFTSLEGFLGDIPGEAAILTDFVPSAGSQNYLQDDASISWYSRTAPSTSGYVCGGLAGTANNYVQRLNDDQTIRVRFNSSNQTNSTPVDMTGFFTLSRDGASDVKTYRNKASMGTNVDASTGITDLHAWLCRYDSGGVGGRSGWIDIQISIGAVGGKLTSGEHDDFTDAVEVYMDSNSKGVIT